MGKVKKTFKESIHAIPEEKKPLPTPDTNPVDGDKLIEETKPKKVKKIKEKPKKLKSSDNLETLIEDIDTLGDWTADIDDEVKRLSKLLSKIAKRMGLE